MLPDAYITSADRTLGLLVQMLVGAWMHFAFAFLCLCYPVRTRPSPWKESYELYSIYDSELQKLLLNWNRPTALISEGQKIFMSQYFKTPNKFRSHSEVSLIMVLVARTLYLIFLCYHILENVYRL
jgi:hypothetical protein